jgi:uncharacterized ferritin-like protein (DUF455 family)
MKSLNLVVQFLQGLNYALLRLQEIKCYQLIVSKDLNQKASIGQSLGYQKDIPARIVERLNQLFFINDRICAPLGLDKAITELIKENGVYACCLVLEKKIFDSIDTFASDVAVVADEPTYRLLCDAMHSLVHNCSEQTDLTSQFEKIELTVLDNFNPLYVSVFEELPLYPGRPGNIQCGPDGLRGVEVSLYSNSDVSRFIHFVAINIEVCAMEVCAYNILKYRDMPQQFRADMAQQIWDEARHFIVFKEYLSENHNVNIGDFPYQFDVWEKHQLGSNLVEQLAIEQVLQEGDAIANNLRLMQGLNKTGMHSQLVELLRFVNADEGMHTRNGNKWMRYLCQNQDLSYLVVLEMAATKIGKSMPQRSHLNPKVIDFLGFPAEYRELVS